MSARTAAGAIHLDLTAAEALDVGIALKRLTFELDDQASDRRLPDEVRQHSAAASARLWDVFCRLKEQLG